MQIRHKMLQLLFNPKLYKKYKPEILGGDWWDILQSTNSLNKLFFYMIQLTLCSLYLHQTKGLMSRR